MQIDKDVLAIVNEGQIDPEIVVQVNNALERIKNPDNAYETIEFNIKPLLIENEISIDAIIPLISSDARKRLGQVFKTKKYTDDDLSVEFKDIHKMESLNEDMLISIKIPIKLYSKDPYTTELYIKKDKESGNYKTAVHNPRKLGKDIEVVAPTMDELRAKLVDYYQSIDYDVDFEEGTAAYLTDDKQIVNKAFTESKNEDTMQVYDAIGNVLAVGDTVAHITGGDGYSKLRIERGTITAFKNGKVQIDKGGLSSVQSNKLVKTV